MSQSVPQQSVPQQKVQRTLLRYLIPDLSNMVLKYSWPVKYKNKYILLKYGNYEEIRKFCARQNMGTKNKLIFCACYDGYKKIVRYLISNLNFCYDSCGWAICFNSGLRGACRGGDIGMVKFVIQLCKKQRILINIFDWKQGIISARKGGNSEVEKLMVDYMIGH